MTELTGTFQYEDASPVTGYATIDLVVGGQYVLIGMARETATGNAVPESYRANISNGSIASVVDLNGNTMAGGQIFSSNEISPPDTSYRYTLFDNLSRPLSSSVDLRVEGSSYDLSASIATQATVILFKPGIASAPPSSNFRVSNLYVNTDGKLTVEYDTTPV